MVIDVDTVDGFHAREMRGLERWLGDAPDTTQTTVTGFETVANTTGASFTPDQDGIIKAHATFEVQTGSGAAHVQVKIVLENTSTPGSSGSKAPKSYISASGRRQGCHIHETEFALTAGEDYILYLQVAQDGASQSIVLNEMHLTGEEFATE